MTATHQAASMSALCSASRSGRHVPTAGHKRFVIAGATGMVGEYALRHLFEHAAIGRVPAIGRRNLGISRPNGTRLCILISRTAPRVWSSPGRDAHVLEERND